MEKIKISVQAIIKAPTEKVWEYFTLPQHITQWYFASDDWHAPKAENDLRVGGKFLTRMEAKDGSFGFDFEGVYENIVTHKLIVYGLADERKVTIDFVSNGNETTVIENFDAETINPIEMQQGGWQAILDNFKKYTEEN